MSRFEIRDKFYLDGKPFKVISGSIHYFRTVPEYWQDRLEKLVNIGCNTVETYIPWNFHETEKGNFNWDGMHDICRFIELADKLGLYMIIRPSPYICSEWEFGGLPAWLLKDRSMRLRCFYKPYLNAVDSYYSVLMPKLAPYQIDNGGNIIMMQSWSRWRKVSMRQQENKKENFRENPTKLTWIPKVYNYAERTGNLKAEAVGVVSGEKHFPVFEDRMVFKPLTKSKPLSTPLFACAEVFWSWVIDTYFVPAPLYQLAFCRGYEAECEKYYDYGTVSPMIYEEGEHLLNLLEFFRTYPDEKVQIDDYLNYCQMFYDYTEILEADYFQTHRGIAEDLAMQILISVLKGDQNYHYENIAFVCDASGQILRLAPMIDHEFSTCFMFPDNLSRHNYWFGELQRSIEGKPVQPDEYKDFPNEKERRLMEKSATCLHRNLVYIKEHYPEVTASFLENVSRLKSDLLQKRESFFIRKAKDYPDHANSDAYRIGKARYKDHDEEKAAAFEKQYGGEGKEISFDLMNCLINYEVQEIIEQMEKILR